MKPTEKQLHAIKSNRDLAKILRSMRDQVDVITVNLIAAKITTCPTDRAYYFRTAIERLDLVRALLNQAEQQAARVKKLYPFLTFP